MKKLARGIAGLFARAVQTIIVGALAVSLIAVSFAIADYTATQGTGITMASVVISLKHYFAIVLCDATAGESQCAAVNASGQVAIQAPPTLPLPTSAATSALQTTGNTTLSTINTTLGSPMQASGGSVTVNAGTNLNTSALATSANQTAASPADESAFTQGTTPITQIGCLYISSYTAITTGHVGVVSCTSGGAANVNVVNTATQVTPGNGISAPTGTPPSTSSPTTSFNEAYNGSTWDAMQDDANKNLRIVPQAFPAGGWTPKHFVAANSDNATSLKTTAGTVHAIEVYGIDSAPAYLKFYNKASSPTCGSDAVVKSIMIPAASTAANGAGANVATIDVNFSTGIAYCVVKGIADTDDTSVDAASYIINIDWN